MGKKASIAVTRRPLKSSLRETGRTRLQLGDVIGFKSPNGFCYAQYVRKHTTGQAYGELLRVIDGCSPTRDSDAEQISLRRTLYVCFCRPQAAIKAGTAWIVGNATVPAECAKIPKFKWAFRNIISGRVIRWEIWDGKTRKGKPVDSLSAEQKKYPLLEIVTLQDIVNRMVEGWMPEDECKPGAASVFGGK